MSVNFRVRPLLKLQAEYGYNRFATKDFGPGRADPGLFICDPTPVEVDQTIGERSHTDFGFNEGGGVSFTVTDTARFHAEVRYIHTNDPTFNDSTGH